MPLYNYYCETCKSEFETIAAVADRHSAECPECGAKGRQLPTTFAVTTGPGTAGGAPRSTNNGGNCWSGG